MTRSDPGQWISVQNNEGRWSVWPAELPVPAGWRAMSAAASREACLAEIETRWTDPRPNSLKEATS
ncbi:MbtH family NRPS accessory protein [Phaeobacter sp. HF9A]|uniref:MbtH family protein n=1 Tax=Phaeobacter sp. HF9A TaxID=2721561 RepID=UPI001430B410|nr:MbtH family NRPS accessory protein [Phaeobacter sp. HF9A]NIZ12298.1 MbtH family NRPS accessory protein [Phaeobacter sp. HF9A]